MKKKSHYYPASFRGAEKLLRIMKISFIILTVCTLSISASVFSQAKTLSLDLKDVTIRRALDEIEKQTGFKFFYIDEQVDVSRKVNLVLKDKSVEDALNEIFDKDKIQYKIFENKLIVIAPNITTEAKQQTRVTGRITDATSGDPLPGVNIIIEGTTVGATTDMNGNYDIDLPGPNVTLVFSYIGYNTEKVQYSGQATIDMQMVPDIKTLDEVVVVGYGTQKKSDVTGALVSVGSKELNNRPVSNAFEALQGKAAGVDITSNERPGEIGKVLIRGTRSLTATSDPLYVVDGVTVMSTSTIETLNPRDIESVDILKDASATAIYGSRGANGVVLITTKRGKQGKLSLEYSGNLTFENIVDRAPMMNASEYITWRRWAAYNAGQTTVSGDQPTQVNDNAIFSKLDQTSLDNIMKGWTSGTWDGSKVTSTDWTKFVTQTALTQEHSLSASGGTDKMRVYGSFGYLNQDGTQIGQKYNRYTTKISIDIDPVKWFSLGASINSSWSNQDYGMSTLGASSSSGPNSIYAAAQRVYAYALPYDSNGDLILRPGGDDNVYTVIDEWNKSTQQRQMLRALGSFYGQIDFGNILKPLKGLKYRMNFGPDYRNWREGVYIDKNSVNRLGGTSLARLRNQRDFSWTLDNILSYNNDFGKHSIGVTLLQTASSWNIETSSLQGQNIARPEFLWNAFNTLDVTSTAASVSIGSGLTKRQLTSYMGRLNYSFNDRYLLTVSGRFDGASQLAEGNKWAFFPSAALAWRMDKEEFLQNVSWLSQLKFRLGVGSTGNSAVTPGQTLGPIQSFYVPFGGATNTIAYTTNEPNYTATQISMANKDMGWEYTTQYNLGVDFSIFRGRLNGTVDVYKSNTKDLLMTMIIPTLTGYPNTTANIGETKNKGIDISLNAVNVQTKDFQWSTSINAAWQKDEIVSLATGKTDDKANLWFIGNSISVIYGIDGGGVFNTSDSAYMKKLNSKISAPANQFTVGKAMPIDKNNDSIINADDRVIIGNTNPRWTLGLSNTFTYKGIELSVMVYGRFGYKIATGGESQIGRYNQREIDYWTPDNPNAEYQKPIYNEAGGDAYSGVLGYRSGSFLKIRDISLGYNFPKTMISKLGIENLKVYVQAKNPGYIYSSIDWIDLDNSISRNGTSGNPTVISTVYNRGFVFGVNVVF